MKLKKFRTGLSNAILVAIVAIFLAGTTGLSFKAHFCHDKLSGVAFFTELGIQKPATCGCKDDGVADKSSKNRSFPLSFHKSSCCSNISFFNKLNIETTVLKISSPSLDFPVLRTVLAAISFQPNHHEKAVPVSGFRQRYKPLTGRKLVLFLSQQRIPPISYCF